MSNDVLGYSSHDWRKHTDDAVVVDDKEYDATIDITSSWPLIGIGGVNREVVFGTACQLPDGRWIEKR